MSMRAAVVREHGGIDKITLEDYPEPARLVTCGATAGFEEQIDIRYIWTYEHNLLGSNGWRRSDITAMLDYAAEQKLIPVIDKVMPLDQVHDAERLLEDRKVFGKVVLKPG